MSITNDFSLTYCSKKIVMHCSIWQSEINFYVTKGAIMFFYSLFWHAFVPKSPPLLRPLTYHLPPVAGELPGFFVFDKCEVCVSCVRSGCYRYNTSKTTVKASACMEERRKRGKMFTYCLRIDNKLDD